MENLKSVTDIDHSQFTGPDYDLSKDGVSVTTTNTIGDYKIVVSRASFSASGKSAGAKGYIQKGNSTLLTFEANGSDVQFGNDDELKSGKGTFSVDILGLTQVKGSVKDLKAFVDYMDKADKYDQDEKRMKQYVSLANEQIDANVYYDKASKAQAKLQFDVFKGGWYNYNEGKYHNLYTIEPIIVFPSGAQQSMGDFFNENDFRVVIDTFNQLIDGWENAIDK